MGNIEVKKVCSFTISSIHFSIMILPYINKEQKEAKDIITILEGNLEKNIQQVLSKITLNKDSKENILKLDWKATNIDKKNIEKEIKSKILTEEDNLCFVVYGSEKYINKVNNIINTIIYKNQKNIQHKKIKIIDCYSVNDFNENIREILDNHDLIFNTSGEHKKEEIFEDYYSA